MHDSEVGGDSVDDDSNATNNFFGVTVINL